jgi:Leucine-rich repeat (LRR) protein
MPSNLKVVLLLLVLATPAFLFWLWLVFLPATVAILCPQGCWCDSAGHHFICNGTSITALLSYHFTNIQFLELYFSKITILKENNFASLAELEALFLSSFKLKTIELGAFNGLTNLADLRIRYTDIIEIIPGTFENMTSLVSLTLDYNKLEHLDSSVFSGLFNLEYIYLIGNKLKYLDPDMLLLLPKFRHITLHNNLAPLIPTDRNFIKSTSLSILGLSYSNISSVSVETFANVSALELLDLSDNNMLTLDINILRTLPKLSKLFLAGNPLQCDCQLQEVWRWCKDRNIQTVSGKGAEM